MQKQFQVLHEEAKRTAQRFKRAEADLLEILQKIEEKKVFLHYGHTSLFQYAVEELDLTEHIALNFIKVARKAREIPELKKEIQKGNLSVSKARKITSVIKKENFPVWLEKLKTLPQKELEKEVAKMILRREKWNALGCESLVTIPVQRRVYYLAHSKNSRGLGLFTGPNTQ